MKYLLNFLEGIPEAPNLSDPDFQQLLVDVQAGKSQTKSSDAFYESLERIVNDLRSSPEAAAFLKPVSKRDAPDYHLIITKPMDLSTVLRNIRNHKYKSKADFAMDLDLIWENCLTYNTQETHPLRAAARFMQQKANYHLEHLTDRNERFVNPLLPLLSATSVGSPSGTRQCTQGGVSQGTSSGSTLAVDEEDAAGESDGEGRSQGKQQPSGPNGLATPDAAGGRGERGASIASTIGDFRKSNGPAPPPFRPKLTTTLDMATALIRTPFSMTHYLPVSLHEPGPSFSDKGKAKEILYGNVPPPWYPGTVTAEDEETRLEGAWWGSTSRDDSYVTGLPAVPQMLQGPHLRPTRPRRKRTIVSKEKEKEPTATTPPPLVPSKPISLERVVCRTFDKLSNARKLVNQVQDWQRLEADGMMVMPPPLEDEVRAREARKIERGEAKRKRKAERVEVAKRRKEGREVGEPEAALSVKRATASLLGLAGFEGSNEMALDIFTRVAIDHIRGVGRTLRLLVDNFSHQMKPDEILLHALHENGQVDPADLETHIKDDIERESAKIAEIERKVRQSYKDLLAGPVIQDDMIFAADGEMLQHGDFAEDLGEDFLGLRELGIDKEFGLSSLSVPKALFFGRRGRLNGPHAATKNDLPDYPPPPEFVQLNPATYQSHVPALLHAFYASRIEAGLGLADDPTFDQNHSQIGPLGQIVVKKDPAVAAAAKKQQTAANKKELAEVEKKKVLKKPAVQGVGKGNWIRPSKEERERRAAEKRAAMEKSQVPDGVSEGNQEDAEGEDE